MLRIAHIADVHWRGLTRHDVYKQVFDAFVTDASSVNTDIVFVGGDIFHTKTAGISPEYIEINSQWMRDLSTIAPTHLILGNHDGNLVNRSRQDAVTPIYDLVRCHQTTKHPLYLWKFSGVYDLAPGYKLCLFSIFDEENWDSVKPVPGCVNIAAYHGPVQGSKTETGYEVKGDVSVDMFKDYDFVLLGDIHKQQFLSYRKTIDGKMKPWIGYPGSTIQQNFAEDLVHGYLFWEIESQSEWDVSFRPLPNPSPFVTINWTGNKDTTLQQISGVKNPKVRIKSDTHLSQLDFEAIETELKTKYNASEIIIKNDIKTSKSLLHVDDTNTSLQRDDLRNPDVVFDLVKKFHRDSRLSTFEWDNIRELIKLYLKQVISDDDTARNTSWSLKQLKWDNTFTYGSNNIINFDKLTGITGIFGPNRCGKSSIPGTIMYNIFNDSDRGSVKNQYVCNVRHPYCYTRSVIGIDSVDYVIERQTVKNQSKKGVESASTSLNLWKTEPDGSLTDLVGEQRSDTEKVLRKLLGSSEDFLLTSMSSQGEFDSFIKQGSTARWRTLTKFLDLEIFAKMSDLVKEDVKSFKAQLKNFPEKNWDELFAVLKKRQLDCGQQLQQKTNDIDEIKLKLHDAHAKFRAISTDIKPVTQSQLDVAISRRDALQQSYEETLIAIQEVATLITDNITKIKKITQTLNQYDVDSLRSRVKNIDVIRHKISSLKHDLDKKNTLLLSQKKSAKLLDVVPCGDQYPTCTFIKDAHINKGLIVSQDQLVAEAQGLLDEAQKNLKKVLEEELEVQLEKLEKLKNRKGQLEIDNLNYENKKIKLKMESDALEKKINVAISTVDELSAAITNNVNTDVITLRNEINVIEAQLTSLDSERIQLATRMGSIEAEINKLTEEKRRRDEILNEMNIHEVLSSAFARKGIPRSILQSQLPIINEEISRILNDIADYTVEFDIADNTDKLDIYLKYNNSRRIIELGSGMEKMISSVAIRVALINTSTLPRSNVYFIDEGFGSLDPQQIESCCRLLEKLKEYFKNIIVISHVDAIKDTADNIIEINHSNKDSHVLYD